jgi:2C-methyl-D-erythritol 2,4-cyclodiphosphate synthase
MPDIVCVCLFSNEDGCEGNGDGFNLIVSAINAIFGALNESSWIMEEREA